MIILNNQLQHHLEDATRNINHQDQEDHDGHDSVNNVKSDFHSKHKDKTSSENHCDPKRDEHDIANAACNDNASESISEIRHKLKILESFHFHSLFEGASKLCVFLICSIAFFLGGYHVGTRSTVTTVAITEGQTYSTKTFSDKLN